MLSEPQAFAHPDSDHQHVLGHRECHLWCSASCVSSGDLKAAPRQPVLELTSAKWGFSGWMIWSWRPRSTKLYLSQTVVKKEKIFGGFWAPNQALIHGVLSVTSKETTTTVVCIEITKSQELGNAELSGIYPFVHLLELCCYIRTEQSGEGCCGAVADHVMIPIVNSTSSSFVTTPGRQTCVQRTPSSPETT